MAISEKVKWWLVALLVAANLLQGGVLIYQDLVIETQQREIRALFRLAFPEQ